MGQPTRESLLLLLLLVTAQCTRAQQVPPSSFNDGDGDNLNGYGANFNAATAILIVVIVTGFFFLGFFSVYFRRCSRNRLSTAVVPTAAAGAVTASRRGARRGLDPAVIETFPTLTYSAATSLRIGKEALECAVCLSEFSADEELRMLPRCCHVFHPECIDTWLEGHVTCPVCRDNLSVVPTTDDEGPEEEADGGGGAVTVGGCDEVAVIDVPASLGRSRTTGHDHPHVITTEGGGDRYTLRLPEQVRREIVEAASGSLRRSASVAVFRGSGGEGSSRRSAGRSLWVGVSDRWTAGILARVATWRRREAEGSVKAAVDGGESSTSVDSSGKSTTVNVLDQV